MRCQVGPGRLGHRPKRLRITMVGLFLTSGVSGLARGDDPPAHRKDVVELTRCRVEFSRSALMGCPQPGVLKECLVRAGDRVAVGQILGRLRNEDVLTELELRNVPNESFLPIQLAEARKVLAETNLVRTKLILKRGYVSDADLRKSECEAQVARLEVETAIQQKQMAEIQARQARVMIHFRELVSPHEGMVIEIYKNPGEGITPLTPVFRIVDDQRMRVVGQLDVIDSWRVHVGQAVRAWPTIPGVDLPVEREMFEGRVIQVENQIDTSTNTSKVVVEIENRNDLLRAGLEARIEIDLNANTAGAVKPASAPQFREAAPLKPLEPKPDVAAQKK